MRIKIKKLIQHIKRWNEWRKGCLNNPVYKFLVLFRVIDSPTFRHFWSEDDAKEFREGFLKRIREAADGDQKD